MTMNNPYLDLPSFRSRLGEGGNREFWQSIDELSRDEGAFEEFLHREFPQEASSLGSGVDRRDFLRLMGASLALGGLAACTRPVHHIVPYVKSPEDIVPGRPLFFATTMTLAGNAVGLLVETHTGRPTKIEGNPQHPASLGATDPFAQAAVLSLYDPDRSQTVRYLGDTTTWSAFLGALQPVLLAQKDKGGSGLRLLTESVVSPTLGAQIKRFLTQYPAAKWHQYEPTARDNALEGARLAFGTDVNSVYWFNKAKVVVSLDADVFSSGPGNLRYVRDFMSGRRVRSDKREMNRLYVVESMLSGTGSVVDHRLPLRASDVEGFARSLAAALGVGAPAAQSSHAKWIDVLARDLQQNRGASLIVAGDHQPPAVHAIAHALNASLGNAGNTVTYTDPIETQPENQNEGLRQLVAEMRGGAVEALVMIGGNPAFNAPADLRFAEAMEKVRFRAHMSLYYDETSSRSHRHIPQTHFLEEWSDARAFDGTPSIVQPMIAPLYNGHSAHELLATLTEETEGPYELVRNYWRTTGGAGDFESFWQQSLNDGVISGMTLPARGAGAAAALPPASASHGKELEVIFKSDPMIHDGRFANNGWLQELPKPMTKLTWDNAALMSPATARSFGVGNDEMVAQVVVLERAGVTVEAPVWQVPGHADNSITIHFGHGRQRCGQVGNGTGFNAYALRSSDTPWIAHGITLRETGRSRTLACTQVHQSMHERDLVRVGSIEEFKASGRIGPGPDHHDEPLRGPTLYPAFQHDGYAWGMSIDTSVCTGCNGCVIACQSENNIPIVGKKEVITGREMHWLRIDHYYRGEVDDPNLESYHMPVPCMHCENAPCEPVCPVEATSHSPEGINEMTYNRCVGTKYCSNNCPYKVRRFNFFQYSDYETQSLKGMRNPDVTVRSRGVMEKCTYCVQRVNAARIDAEREGRPIRDGEVVTACQAACPAEAIVFGNIKDPQSRVAKLKAEPSNYGLLAELNTQPRTTYLPTVRNPNPEMPSTHTSQSSEHGATEHS